MEIKNEDVLFYRLEGEVVCPECATEKELDTLKADEVFADGPDFEDVLIFCDRCKKRL